MKVAIDEIARFMVEGWPGNDWYIEDDDEEHWKRHLNLEHNYAPRTPGTIVNDADFNCAVLYQGIAEDPTNGDGYEWVSLFRKWRKALKVTLLSVEIPNEKIDEVRQLLKNAGCKVLN
jgi:hypothetical protein